ncbi:acetolactate decarboxylase [Granulicella sp. WH15]|uniref:acetolactate decarboxylase n=1 Tax=Granulicella sp. WH15 TaxID=2602070 RepID=UPI0013669AF5|nr:acetolactate decarboxylase [Granulicella sp. WH15]QHN03595.1 acetolactate decarboxylase [Granulicella sp. WH15]
MPILNCSIPRSLETALANQVRSTGQTLAQIVSSTLAHCLNVPLHTLFQVSTSGALVKGVYEGAVSAGVLKRHGNFGLGTFEDLDGEMAILEGHIYQAKGDGTVVEAPDSASAPFAVVTQFEPDEIGAFEHVEDIGQLTSQCDTYRQSNNLFYAFRIDGHFERVHTRAMRATTAPLAQAAASQPEFEFHNVDGTLVGIWSPQFASAFNVPGYHFHFLSLDRSKGGHLLDCTAGNLHVQIEKLSDLHISLPESEEFLKADFSQDPSTALAYAEQVHK